MSEINIYAGLDDRRFVAWQAKARDGAGKLAASVADPARTAGVQVLAETLPRPRAYARPLQSEAAVTRRAS